MINRRKGMLTTGGLIMKKKKIMGMSGKRDSGPTWFMKKPEEKGTALRNQELKQAKIKKRQVWCPKDKPDESGRSARTCMVCFLLGSS
jgi:hypothetical protein